MIEPYEVILCEVHAKYSSNKSSPNCAFIHWWMLIVLSSYPHGCCYCFTDDEHEFLY